MIIKFNEYNLQSTEILTENITYRTFPNRELNIAPLSGRPGAKFLSEEFGAKNIEITGRILGTSVANLKDIIDDFHEHLAKPSKQLDIDDRSYVATCQSLEMPDLRYGQTMATFKAVFVCADPFAYSFSRTLPILLTAGDTSEIFATTISGSAFSEPVVTVTFSGNAGDSGVSSVLLDHLNTGEKVTVSGNFERGLSLVFNYQNATVTYSGLLFDYVGSFSQYDSGSNQLKIDLGGTNTYGVTGEFQYRPRYYA